MLHLNLEQLLRQNGQKEFFSKKRRNPFSINGLQKKIGCVKIMQNGRRAKLNVQNNANGV